MAELTIQQKISRMIMKSAPRIQNMRKPDKFTIGGAIQESQYRLLRLCVVANMERGSKKQYQNQMDQEIAVLRTYIDMAVMPEVRLISAGLHEEWAKELSEIGRLLGAWIKKTQ